MYSLLRLETLSLTNAISQLIRASMPVIIGFAAINVMRLIDIMMINRLDDSYAISALGLASVLKMVISVFFLSIGQSLQYYVALAKSPTKTHPSINEALGIMLVWALLCGLLFGVIAYLMLPEISRLLSDDWLLRQKLQDYFKIWLTIGLLPEGMAQILIALFIGLNKTRHVALILVSSTLVNIVSNWIFIYGHFGVSAMGLRGAAYGIGLTGVYEFLICLILARKHFKFVFFRNRLASYVRFWCTMNRHGLPIAFKLMSEPLFMLVVYQLIGQLGTTQLALFHVFMTIMMFNILIYRGVGVCVQNKLSEALNRTDRKSANDWYQVSVYVMSLFVLWVVIALNLFPQKIMSWFLSEASGISLVETIFSILSMIILIYSVILSSSFYLFAARKPELDLILSLVFNWAIFIPCVWWSVSEHTSLSWIYFMFLAIEAMRMVTYMLVRRSVCRG